MEIGIFKAALDGYAGIIQFIGQSPVAVAIVPTEKTGTFSVLLAGKKDKMTLKIGQANAKNKKLRLSVVLDSPLFKAPIVAELDLNADHEGNYLLKWER
jgi:uncharacterized protein (DUF736 family)